MGRVVTIFCATGLASGHSMGAVSRDGTRRRRIQLNVVAVIAVVDVVDAGAFVAPSPARVVNQFGAPALGPDVR
jgi:hypothetical protein